MDTLDSILSRYHHHLASEKRYSPRTVTSYERDLHDFIQWLEKQATDTDISLGSVQTWQIRHWISQLHRKGLSGKSLQRKLSSIRRCYRFLLREGLVEHNPAVDVQSPNRHASCRIRWMPKPSTACWTLMPMIRWRYATGR